MSSNLNSDDYVDWWIAIVCTCGRADSYVPVRMIREAGMRDLTAYARRLSCRECGSRPSSVELVERADRHRCVPGGGTPAAVVPLPSA